MTKPPTRFKLYLSLVLVLVMPIMFASCFESEVEKINKAIAELEKANRTFDDIKNILEGLKKNLDDGVYKDQVDDLIGRAGQVAQLSAEGSVDFVRTRIKEDLERMKAAITNSDPPARVPVLSNAQSPKIDYTSVSRSTLTVVGWNLDMAHANPQKYRVVIKNSKEADRAVDGQYITFQGQYAVTINTSSSGIPLRYFDTKLVFEGFDPLFELAIIRTDPPPEPEIFTELFIESHQDQDDKDKDINAVFRVLFDNNAYVDFSVGKGNTWNNPGKVTIKVWKENPNNRLCRVDAINKYGPSFPGHASEIDSNCDYLIVQSNLNKFIRGSAKKGALIIEETEDNSGWNAHFTLKGKTSKGNNVVLVSTGSEWFGDGHTNSFKSEFSW